jgi:hypothetical protein
MTDAFWVYVEGPGGSDADPASVGKWMLFVPVGQADQWWDTVRNATQNGLLGIGAKVGTARRNPRATSDQTRLICVYTRDWQDQADACRVLGSLRDLGVRWRLAYKTDEATTAGVYGRGSSVYVSHPGSRDFEDRIRYQDTLF